MKVLLVHSYYQYKGGEDQVFINEGKLLANHGLCVPLYTEHNRQVQRYRWFSLATTTIWNRRAYDNLRKTIRREDPKVIHFHNTFPLLSPSVYDAAYAEGVPVVQTLHNYRLLCPNALFLRNGKVCTDCLDRGSPIIGAIHGCYRGSRSASSVTALMLMVHRARRTWQTRVDRYIALSEFARKNFIHGGLPAEKIAVKPNFVSPDPGIGSGASKYALFVGRLSPEKGLRVLLDAWQVHKPRVPLKIIGDGPDAPLVISALERCPEIEWLGQLDNREVLEWIKKARVLVLPSVCYENFPITLAESYACGTPVIASDIGSLHALIASGQTGLRFQTGDSAELAVQVERIFCNDAEWLYMRQGAREEFLQKYTAERNYEMLMDIYQQAIDSKH